MHPAVALLLHSTGSGGGGEGPARTHAEDTMGRILVLYGTTEGHTAKVAAAVAEELRAHGAEVDVIEAGTADPRPEHYAGVIVAASVHGGAYQRPVRRWVRSNRHALAGRPTAFISVSLAVLQQQPKVQREVSAIVERFVTATGWWPTWTKSIAGALAYSKYGWFKRWIMRRIAEKAGGDTDTSRDYEYTDWRDLRAFADRFAQVTVPVVTIEGKKSAVHDYVAQGGT
jgi:menaquinone-dependent protoporphyrinogen oxidase